MSEESPPAATGRLAVIFKKLARLQSVINNRLLDRGKITIHFKGLEVDIHLEDVKSQIPEDEEAPK